LFQHFYDVNIERFRPGLEVETPDLMTSGQLLLPSILFANTAMTRPFEVIAKIF
jgi:hypothetical protein